MNRFAYKTEYAGVTKSLIRPLMRFAWDAEQIQVAVDNAGDVLVDFGELLSGPATVRLAEALGCHVEVTSASDKLQWRTIHSFVPDH